MTKKIFFVLMLMAGVLGINEAKAQKHEFANWKRYEKANAELPAPAKSEKRVVLMGDSITDGWPRQSPEFFADNNLVGRGIGGQTSYQFLLRFRQDVLELKPYAVVINYGTNDIAGNTGDYDEDKTFGNVVSMVELAKANKIKVILASTLPAEGFNWRPQITDGMDKIRSLNERVKAYAKANKIPYVDYFSALVSEDGKSMKTEYANDKPAVHPNKEGYKVMESLLLPVIEKVR